MAKEKWREGRIVTEYRSKVDPFSHAQLKDSGNMSIGRTEMKE